MPPHLLGLPSELIVRILSNLFMPDLAICRRTNHFLRNLIEDSVELQYLIELEVSGMEDNPYSTMAVSKRLGYLKAMTERWTTLSFSRKICVTTEPFLDLFDFSSGVFLHLANEGKTIRYVKVPQSPAHTPIWRNINIGRRIIGWAPPIPQYDLLALSTITDSDEHATLQIDIVLLHFSSGKYHGSAREPIIRISDIPALADYSKMDICGDILATMISQHRNTRTDWLYLHDWTTGTCKAKFTPAPCFYGGFQFLSPNAFVLINRIDWSLDIYRVNDSIDPESVAIKLELPALNQSDRIIDVKACRVSPNRHSHTPYCTGDEDNVLDIASFHARPENALLMFEFTITAADSSNLLRFTVHRSSLLSHLKNVHGSEPSTTPWDVWGPSVSRWFNVTRIGDMHSAMVVNGQRFAAVGPGQASIVIYDFNPTTLRRLSLENWGPGAKQPQSSVVHIYKGLMALPGAEDLFRDEIGSVMIDEDKIVATKMNDAKTAITGIEVFDWPNSGLP